MHSRLKSAAALAVLANLPDNGRRIITRGVLDMVTLQFDRSAEESFFYRGPMALADAATESAALKKAVDEALDKHFLKVKETMTEFEKQLKEKTAGVSDSVKEEIVKLNKEGGKLISDQQLIIKEQSDRLLNVEQKLASTLAGFAAGQGATLNRKSLGEQFAESEEFKSFMGTKNMPPMKGSSQVFFTKSITNLPGSGGPGIFPEYLPTPIIPNFQPLTIRDLLGQGTTETNVINWVQENVFTDNAGYQGSEGSLKPQSDISYVLKTINVATIGHWIKASKQTLSDFKLLQTLINARLSFGLKLAEEREILFGDGNTNHLHGLVPQATAYNTALNKAGDQMLDVIRHAMLQTTLSFYPATGVALSPTDWHNIEILKDGFHRYLFSNPAGTIPAMVWGLPVAQCFSFGGGEFLVGSFKLAVTLFDREQASILVSTEDQDNFVRNMVTILAEERLALGVSRPLAIVSGSFPSGSTSD